jgi:hypothetical protein
MELRSEGYFCSQRPTEDRSRSRPTWSHELPATSPTRLVLLTGLVVGPCILGDAFLYGIFPLEAADLGIVLSPVGVLLSANQLVRRLSNTVVGGVYERFVTRRPFALFAMLGITTTAVYAVGYGLWMFLPAASAGASLGRGCSRAATRWCGRAMSTAGAGWWGRQQRGSSGSAVR